MRSAQMTFWSDDRNHLLDDLIAFVWFGAVALLIGVPPLQFPLLVLVLRFIESLSHANARISFGWLGERLLVSPRFHRAHHGVLAAGQRSCNYGAVLPWWDMLFGTADFSRDYVPTGVPGADAGAGERQLRPPAMGRAAALRRRARGPARIGLPRRGQLGLSPRRLVLTHHPGACTRFGTRWQRCAGVIDPGDHVVDRRGAVQVAQHEVIPAG